MATDFYPKPTLTFDVLWISQIFWHGWPSTLEGPMFMSYFKVPDDSVWCLMSPHLMPDASPRGHMSPPPHCPSDVCLFEWGFVTALISPLPAAKSSTRSNLLRLSLACLITYSTEKETRQQNFGVCFIHNYWRLQLTRQTFLLNIQIVCCHRVML